MKKIHLVLFLGLLISLLSCNKEMKIAEKEIEVGTFSTLTIDNRFNIVLTQGTEERISVSGHPDLIKKVSCRLDSNELRVSSSFKSAWLRPKNNKVTLHITVKNLKRININQTCDITCTNAITGNEIGLVATGKVCEAKLNLDCTVFYCWNNLPCGGKITLNGQVDQLKIWNYALMQIDATELHSPYAYLENYSKGDISARIDQQLTYKIAGEGNIRVQGVPATIQSLGEDGVGALIIE